MASVKKVIRKGLGNKKDYLLHTLKNGMKCLLVSQVNKGIKKNSNYKAECNVSSVNDTPEVEEFEMDDSCSSDEELNNQSESFAMSLSVNIGSFSDPIEAQGIAHLLEHTISMGSERYPRINEFEQFMYLSSGYTNAETGCEYTNFYFEVPMAYSREASDIFASLFEAPNLTKESINKEKHAVDSEFQMAITSDDSRIQRLLSLCANSENPAGKFFWGNLQTLHHENLREMVVDFWKKHYSASRMTLAVQSNQPTHEMVKLIDDLFGKIPTDNKPAPKFKAHDDPFYQDLFHQIFKVVSVSSTKKIIFLWHLPSIIKFYKIKPLEYISWVVGHEGKGMLINYLRKLNYALELEAGVEDDFCNNSIYSIFSLGIELTDLGFENVDRVIELTFGFLNLVRKNGVSEHIFKQIQILAQSNFDFAESKKAIDHVTELSENMLLYDEEDYLSGPSLYSEYSEETIKIFLNLISAKRVSIFISAKTFDNSDVFTEDPIFETKYLTETITEDMENKWSTMKPHPFFKIEVENQFLTTDFSILPLDVDTKYPEKIFENDCIELWYKQDNNFKLPKSYVMFYFISALSSKSVDNYLCLKLLFDSLKFLISEDTYPAVMAQLNYSIEVFMNGFELSFNGFNEKLPMLIDIVINSLNNFKSLMTEDIFEMIKSKAINKLKNGTYNLDYVSTDLKNSLIEDTYWNVNKRLLCLENLTYKQLLTFYEQFKHLYCRTLIQGNINQNQAIDITKKVVSILNYKPLAKECFPVFSVKRLNQGDYRVKLQNYNPNDNNSMAYKYYQFDKSEIQNTVKYQILQAIIEESAFNELRTHLCLGYDVQLNLTDAYERYGFCFIVAHQEKKFETQFIFDRMDDFLESFWDTFNKPIKVNNVRDALIALKEAPDDSLEQEFDKYKNEIIRERFKFDILEIEIEALKKLTFDDVKNLKDGFIGGRSFSVEIVGNDTDDAVDDSPPPTKRVCLRQDKNYVLIENLDEFKNSLNSY